MIVHWRDEASLAALLDALPREERFEVVVVDNGSTAALRVPAPMRLVRAHGNLGFAGGANLGATLARAPLLLLLNPDVVPRPGALAALLAGFAALPDAGGLAPRLLGADGSSQASWQLRALPTPRSLLRHTLFIDAGRGPDAGPEPGAAVEQPAAAALALRRGAWEHMGGLDPRFHPAWFEDVDLARRLADAGIALRYWPAAELVHGMGGSVAPLGYGRFLWCYHRNLCRYLDKHHGRGWSLLARALLVAGALLRTMALPLRRPRRARGARDALRGLAATALGALTNWRRPRGYAAEAPA